MILAPKNASATRGTSGQRKRAKTATLNCATAAALSMNGNGRNRAILSAYALQRGSRGNAASASQAN